MLSPLVPIIRRWKALWENPTTGRVLQNRDGKPVNMNDLSARIIAPNCEKNGIEWVGFYGLRRGFGTLLVLDGATCESVAQSDDRAFWFCRYQWDHGPSRSGREDSDSHPLAGDESRLTHRVKVGASLHGSAVVSSL
jgi:hypothetical protein